MYMPARRGHQTTPNSVGVGDVRFHRKNPVFVRRDRLVRNRDSRINDLCFGRPVVTGLARIEFPDGTAFPVESLQKLRGWINYIAFKPFLWPSVCFACRETCSGERVTRSWNVERSHRVGRSSPRKTLAGGARDRCAPTVSLLDRTWLTNTHGMPVDEHG
jgi:hypothetical protein